MPWKKSCCVYCPFAHNQQNRAELMVRHAAHPDQVAEAMCLEHASLSLNPRGTLYKNQSLIQITTYSGNDAAVVAYRRKLASKPWALYRIRRIYNVNKKDPKKKGQADRAVELLAIIPHTASHLILSRIANHLHSRIDEQHGIDYVYRERTGSTYRAREDFYVTGPAVVETKARYGIEWFNNKWAQRSLF